MFANGLKIGLVFAAERLFIDKTQRVKDVRNLHLSPNPEGLVHTVKDRLASTVRTSWALAVMPRSRETVGLAGKEIQYES